METIQVVLDKKLPVAADRAARRLQVNRSALVRDALREHLLRLEMKAKKERDQEGYAKVPLTLNEWEPWGTEAAWPEE